MKTNSSALIVPSQPKTATAQSVANEDIRDIKPPVQIPNGWAWLWWVFGALALLAALYAAWRYWQKKRSLPKLANIVPPHLRAKEKLRAALALIGEPQPFCISVSDTLRVYLEQRFQFHAPDRTTEEFLLELQNTSHLSPEQKRSLTDFLQRCDLVKFARDEPTQMELEDLHHCALGLVEETEPRPQLSPLDASPVKPVAS